MRLDYLKASDLFKTARDKDAGKPLANNTRLFQRVKPSTRPGGDESLLCYSVRFHRTDIIDIYPDDTYVIRASGWDTHPTTRERINSYSPVPIGSYCGPSMMGFKNPWPTMSFTRDLPFIDEMVFDSNGVFMPERTRIDIIDFIYGFLTKEMRPFMREKALNSRYYYREWMAEVHRIDMTAKKLEPYVIDHWMKNNAKKMSLQLA